MYVYTTECLLLCIEVYCSLDMYLIENRLARVACALCTYNETDVYADAGGNKSERVECKKCEQREQT